jgi:signal transduction histidine kinase
MAGRYRLVCALGVALVATCALAVMGTRAAIGEALRMAVLRSLQQHRLYVDLIQRTSADPDVEIRRFYAGFADDPTFAWNHGGFVALRARDGKLEPLAASRQVEHLLAPAGLSAIAPHVRAAAAAGADSWSARDARGVLLTVGQMQLEGSSIVLLQVIERGRIERHFLVPFGAAAAAVCSVLALGLWAFAGTRLRLAQSRLALQHQEAYRLELEERVRGRTRELERVNADLAAFSHSVSHDLRTPLRGIGGFARILREEHASALDNEGKACLDRVLALTARMRELIDSFLMLSRVSGSEPLLTSFDLGELAREVWSELEELEPERKVELAVAAGVHARGDAALLRIALQNLLGNARKFSAQRKDARVELAMQLEGTTKVYAVRDNGVGFDMGQAGRLFHPFTRLHTAELFPGSGIGLATVRRVVERHGGRIWAESQPGAGASFYFTLSA